MPIRNRFIGYGNWTRIDYLPTLSLTYGYKSK